MKRPSWETLEVYKGFALCAMMGLHSTVWWISTGNDGDLRGAPEEQYLLLFPYFIFFGCFSLSFALSAGTSFLFWIRAQNLGVQSFKAVLVRAAVLAAAGFYLNYRSWYIFQFLGLATLVAYLLLLLVGVRGLVLFGLFVAVISEPLRLWLQPWESSYWVAIVSGNNSGLYFWPFFPWFALFALGAGLGQLRSSKVFSESRLTQLLLLVGLALVNLVFFSNRIFPEIDPGNLWGSGFFRPDLFRFAEWAGIMLVGLALVDWLLRTRLRILLTWFKPISAHSLVIYLVHYKIYSSGVYWAKSSNGFHLALLILAQVVLSFGLGVFLNRVVRTASLMKQKRSLG